jgi:hypothetical protein
MILYIIGGVILAVILVFLGLFIASRMKGKIVLTLTKGGYAPGETIQGELLLTTKKDLEGNRLFVALVGYEEVKSRYIDSDGDSRTETNKHEIYRDELDLEGAGPVIAGASKPYPFQLNTPSGNTQMAGEGGDSMLGKAAVALISTIGDSANRRKIWEVQARYDLKGIDLKAKRKVTVSGV